MSEDFELSAKVFKALCEKNRLRILNILQNGEKCACKLLDTLHINQSTLSHHMKILCDSGIVSGRRDGKWTHYSINEKGAAKAKKLLESYTKLSKILRRTCNCK